MNGGHVERDGPVLIPALELAPVDPETLREKRIGFAAASGSKLKVGEVCLDPRAGHPRQTQTPRGGQELHEELSSPRRIPR